MKLQWHLFESRTHPVKATWPGFSDIHWLGFLPESCLPDSLIYFGPGFAEDSCSRACSASCLQSCLLLRDISILLRVRSCSQSSQVVLTALKRLCGHCCSTTDMAISARHTYPQLYPGAIILGNPKEPVGIPSLVSGITTMCKRIKVF